jgi:translation elongation factor EF-1alpha
MYGLYESFYTQYAASLKREERFIQAMTILAESPHSAQMVVCLNKGDTHNYMPRQYHIENMHKLVGSLSFATDTQLFVFSSSMALIM